MIQERKAEWELRCIEGREREREEASNDSGKEDRMGAGEGRRIKGEKKCRKEKSTVTLVWKNVRKIHTREKQMELEVWMKKNECDVCAINETGLNWE